MSTELDKQAREYADNKYPDGDFAQYGDSIDELVKDLAAFATQVREQSKWVSVADAPPKEPNDGEREFVLVKWIESERGKAGRSASGYDTCLIAYLITMPHLATHWCEIPAPPETTEQEREK